MATPPNIARSFSQTAYYAVRTRSGARGSVSLGTPVSFRCRHEKLREVVRDGAGSDLELTDVIFTDAAIPENVVVWSPGEDQTDATLAHEIEWRESVPALAVSQSAWTLTELRY